MKHARRSSLLLIAAGILCMQGCADMQQAVLENDLSQVERYLEEEKPPVNKRAHGTTSLIVAARYNHMEIAKRLIEKGADVNASNSFGMTALHLAVREHNTEMALFLIGKGADIHAVSDNGYTPLFLASCNNCTQMVKYLIEHGADVNCADKDRMTPLHEAALDGNLMIMDLLLDHGAKVNAVTKDNSAMRLAMRFVGGNIEMAEDEWAPLHYAADAGHFYAVKKLLERGADKTLVTKKGSKTALQLAETRDYVNIVELLRQGDTG